MPGRFNYTPTAGTILTAGQDQVISALFAPSDTADYTTITASTTINVIAATPPPVPPQVLTIAPVSSKQGLTGFTVNYNEPLGASSASNSVLYRIFAAVTKIVKKHKQRLFTRPLAIRSVSPSSSGNMVTINLAKRFKGTVQVTVQGTITATNGASSNVNTSTIVK